MKKGKCKLMEPVMRVDVLTPEDHMGDVIGDLNSRRGMVRTPTTFSHCSVLFGLRFHAATVV